VFSIVKAPEDFSPKWMVTGRANAQAMTEELLKTKTEEELPPFAKEFLAETKKEAHQGGTTPTLSKYYTDPEMKDVLVHVQDLWIVLRKIARTVGVLTLIVMIIPGLRNGNLALDPYEPMVLQILSGIINFAKQALVEGTPSNAGEVRLYIGSPLAPISLYLDLAFFIAIVLSIPVTVRGLLDYVRDGLTRKEYDILTKVTGVSAILFVIGSTLSYTVIMPVTLRILAASGTIIGSDSLEVWFGIEPVLNLLLWGTLGAGVLYASPMVLLALIQLDVLPAEELTKRRKELIFGVFLIAAVVTPDPTLVSMVILSVPMLIVIEGVIYWGLKIETERMLGPNRRYQDD